MLEHTVISTADYTLQEKESQVNGWVCTSIDMCICICTCAGTCNKGGANYYLKENISPLNSCVCLAVLGQGK